MRFATNRVYSCAGEFRAYGHGRRAGGKPNPFTTIFLRNLTMKQRLLFLVLTFFGGSAVFASHIIGGEMIYEFISADTTSIPHTKKFKITLRLFRDEHCGNCALMPPDGFIGIYDNDTKNEYPAPGNYSFVTKADEGEVTIVRPTCISNAPALDYHVATYSVEVTLPDNQNGYTAAYQTCCRVAPIMNAEN